MNSSNPVTWGSVITGMLVSGIGMLNEFGHPLTQGQTNAVMTFAGACIVAAGFVLHNRVTPKSVAQDKIDQAWAAPPSAPERLKPKA
jgi:hypothetical protein